MGELATVRAFTSIADAQVACTVLQSAGLDASLRDEHVISMQWLFSNAVGGVKLQVPAEQLDEAQAVLDAPASIAGATEGTPGDDPCPRCGETEVEPVLWGRQSAVLPWLFIGVPLFPVSWRRRCRRCGTSRSWSRGGDGKRGT